jgi:hypothetical protein
MGDASLNANQETEQTKKKRKKFFSWCDKFEGERHYVTCTLPCSFKMNTFAYQILYPSDVPMPAPTNLDWMELPWGGPYSDEEEDFPIAICGESSCPGDCSICVKAEAAMRRIFLPIQGPLNKDGISLGYLILSE